MAIYSRLKIARVTLPAKQGDYVYAPLADDTNAGVVYFSQLVKVVDELPIWSAAIEGQYYLYSHRIYHTQGGLFNLLADLDDMTKLEDDTTTTAINYRLHHAIDKTFSADGITAITLKMPLEVNHGFYACVNVKTFTTTIDVVFENESGIPLKILSRGVVTETLTVSSDAMVTFLFYSDGILLYCNVVEVSYL